MPDAKATFRLEGEDATAAAFRSALGNVQDFSEKATRLLKGAFGFEIVNIFAEQIKGIAELGDNLVKGAERAGIAQAQFNQLAAAFGEADVSVQSLSKGIKNMEVAISKAANGDSTIAAAFNDIGLSAESLKRLAPDVELLAIAEALSKVEDPTDRARIGTALLGKAFLELEPVLAKGAAGLDEMVRAANGMSPELSERLGKFNEQLNRLWQGFKNYEAYAAGGIGIVFTEIHDAFSPELAARIKAVQEQLNQAGNYAPERLEQLKTQLAGLVAQRDALEKAASPHVAAALDEQGKGNAEAMASAFEKAAEEAIKAQDAVAKANQATLDQWDAETRTVNEKRLEFEFKINALRQRGRIDESEYWIRYMADENKVADALAKQQNAGSISASIKESNDQWRESMTGQAEEARLAQERMRREFEKTGQYSVMTGQLIQATFANAFLSIGQGGLRGLVANFVRAFAVIVANAEAMDLAKHMHLDEAFGNNGGGSALGGIFSGIGSFFGAGGGGDTNVWFNGGQGTAGLMNFATGGSFNVGGSGGTDSQLVAFRATPGEQVSIKTPGQQGGGVTVINNNYIDSRTDSTQIAQMIQASTQRAVQQSKAQMVDLIKRGAFA